MILLLQNHKTYVKLKPINRITKATNKRQHTNFAYLFRNRTKVKFVEPIYYKQHSNATGSVFTELNLTLVEVTPVEGLDNGKDIRLIVLVRGYDKELNVFGWLSKDGIFYFHRWVAANIISRIEKELMDMGYHVKPRT